MVKSGLGPLRASESSDAPEFYQSHNGDELKHPISGTSLVAESLPRRVDINKAAAHCRVFFATLTRALGNGFVIARNALPILAIETKYSLAQVTHSSSHH